MGSWNALCLFAVIACAVNGGADAHNGGTLADGIGDIETGFTARATIQEVAASIPASLNAGRMGAGATAGGETTVTNHFHIAALQVREEADVKKVAKELYNMQKTKTRSKGVVT